jgi:hypothetical protein
MSGITYTVTATFPDEGTASAYIDWLREGHIGQVMARGASSGLIVRIEEPSDAIRVETRYTFPSRAAYLEYVERHAPALRAEGTKRFGGRPGVSFERRTGVVV